MAMADPAEGIKDLLVTAAVGTFNATTGWSIRIAKEQDKPDTHITCYSSGGLASNPKWLLDFPSVQVRVRGAASGYVAARTKMQSVKDTLLGIASQTLNGDRWVAINSIGDINNLGFDDNNRPIFSINFALIIEPVSGDNRDPL